MLSVQYASKTSAGVLAQSIGWINYGTNLQLSNAHPHATITNIIPGGYRISFDASIAVTAEEPYASEVVYSGFPVPTFSAAPFGTKAYTGIRGNVALYTAINEPITVPVAIKIVLSNIILSDRCGNGVNNFLFFAADAETTNKGAKSIAETWSVTTNGTVWSWIQIIPSENGNITAGPKVTGQSTKTVLETGQPTNASTTSSNIFMTQNPTTIVANTTTEGGREGFAFGVIVLDNDISQENVCNDCYNNCCGKCCCCKCCY
ncbi:CshA/CshB family fibrillar adhesin-related protein [Niameybacter massiliensis]|uniref:CshA/CshB family fibrillar adhesin-related protein n=1 Tax=Niameybacter massiliensis TaxID=1658108 RepID=UPI0006B625FA|nr:CshA/CshB family fibrillar adhesin-related protein [Niameybacter massiliensis]